MQWNRVFVSRMELLERRGQGGSFQPFNFQNDPQRCGDAELLDVFWGRFKGTKSWEDWEEIGKSMMDILKKIGYKNGINGSINGSI